MVRDHVDNESNAKLRKLHTDKDKRKSKKNLPTSWKYSQKARVRNMSLLLTNVHTKQKWKDLKVHIDVP